MTVEPDPVVAAAERVLAAMDAGAFFRDVRDGDVRLLAEAAVARTAFRSPADLRRDYETVALALLVLTNAWVRNEPPPNDTYAVHAYASLALASLATAAGVPHKPPTRNPFAAEQSPRDGA